MKIFNKILVISVVLMMAGCSREWEDAKNDWKYTTPCMEGGRYTIIQNSFKIENTKCIYWVTSDDDAIFEKDGQRIYVNGSSIIVEERD